MRLTRPAARAAAALAPVVLVAAGCSLTPDATELVSDESSAGPPVSEADAAAAMLDYFEVVNQALRSGQTDDLAAMTDPACPCEALVHLVDERFDDGGRLRGASFDAGAVTVLERSPGQARVRTRVRVSKYAELNGDGLTVGRQPERTYVATYTLSVDDDAWRVVDVHRRDGR